MSKIKLPKLKKIDSNKTSKPKILLLSDDMRLFSGIGVISKLFVQGTVDKYDWVQLGAAVNHPEHGKHIDISEDVQKNTGVKDASVKVYAWNGYGDANVLNELIERERPDAILHFTDPRFWQWLYNIEHSIRQKMPLMYYNIWDDLPYPIWNEPFYESCDLIMNISRQTQNIVKNVLRKFPKPEWAVQYVPHGIHDKQYFKITELHPEWKEYDEWSDGFKKQNDVDFILFWNNRNIRRKQPSDVILAFKHFCDQLPKEKANRIGLVMKSQVVDGNGTDLGAVKNALCPEYKVFFEDSMLDTKQMNWYYNMADVTVNIASNEGFGISWCESLHAGTPIINNVTGGLQDGCRFEDDNGDWIKFTTDFPTNHDGTYKEHGAWVKPVFPSSRSIQGSPATPFIFDDRADIRDVAEAIKYWYDMPKEERDHRGELGRDWVCGDESNMSAKGMSKRFIECIDACLENWTPRKRFTLYKIESSNKVYKPGVIL